MAGYEVMARRYRPGTFDEVVGQDPVAHTLKNAIAAGRVAHAYLFCGGHGCGKTSMARIFAKALVCQAGDGPTPEPCGKCPACLDVAAGRDSDVVEIDAASNRGVDNIRQLREQAAYVPNRDRFKIYIVDEVHMLSTEAFNALLKTLEEPPPHVKFILATTDPHKIPDTILSRCQRFDFRLVDPESLAAFFGKLAQREGAEIEAEALDAVAGFAGGSVRDGLVLLDQLLSFAQGPVTRADVERLRGVAGAETVAGLFSAFADRQLPRALALVDEAARRGTNVGDFLDQLIDFGRALLRSAAGGSESAFAGVYGPAREALSALAGRVPVDTALLWLDVLTQARTRVRQRVLTNPLVALEMAVARLAGLDDPRPVGRLMARLESLARGTPLPSEPLPPRADAPTAPSVPAASPAGPPPAASMESTAPAVPSAPPASTVSLPSEAPTPSHVVVAKASPAGAGAAQESGVDDKVVHGADNGGDGDGKGDGSAYGYGNGDGDGYGDGGDGDLATARSLWPRVLERLSSSGSSAGCLKDLSPARFAAGLLTLDGSAYAVEMGEDPRRLQRLAQAAADLLRRPLTVAVGQTRVYAAPDPEAEVDTKTEVEAVSGAGVISQTPASTAPAVNDGTFNVATPSASGGVDENVHVNADSDFDGNGNGSRSGDSVGPPPAALPPWEDEPSTSSAATAADSGFDADESVDDFAAANEDDPVAGLSSAPSPDAESLEDPDASEARRKAVEQAGNDEGLQKIMRAFSGQIIDIR